jgi:hypothetical protein
MKSHWIEEDGTVTVQEDEGEPPFNTIQAFCGGYVEHVNVLYEGQQCSMFVHDEGAIRGLPVNEVATDIYWNNARAQGVDPNDAEQRKAMEDAHVERLAKQLGIDMKHISVVSLGHEESPPKIHGPAVLFLGRAS